MEGRGCYHQFGIGETDSRVVRALESELEDVPVPYPRSAENFPQLTQLFGMGAGLFRGLGKVRQRGR